MPSRKSMLRTIIFTFAVALSGLSSAQSWAAELQGPSTSQNTYPSLPQKVTGEGEQTFSFIGRDGGKNSVSFKTDAIDWAKQYAPQISELGPEQAATIYYCISRVLSRLKKIDFYESEYNAIRKNPEYAKVYFPSYVDSGYLIHFLGDTERLTDISQYAQLKGKTVEQVFGYPGDLRLMEDVRGDGTHRTSIVFAQELTKFPLGAWNVFYHEFGHLVHFTLLSKDEFIQLLSLYKAALKNGRTLDNYAATHPSEYFAQGFEAFLSDYKIGETYDYYVHTKAELLLKDPDLYHFIESVVNP